MNWLFAQECVASSRVVTTTKSHQFVSTNKSVAPLVFKSTALSLIPMSNRLYLTRNKMKRNKDEEKEEDKNSTRREFVIDVLNMMNTERKSEKSK